MRGFYVRGLGLVTIALIGCTAPVSDEPRADENIATTQQAIEGGVLATSSQIQRAVRVSTPSGQCTGTRIFDDFVITALHCDTRVGSLVTFYSSGTAFPNNNDVTVSVVDVFQPPGTSWVGTDLGDVTDENGDFADIELVKLSRTNLPPGPTATMSVTYPGSGGLGTKVGGGSHEGNVALLGILMRKHDTLWSGSDTGGAFRTNEYAVNSGDSGGPFYLQPNRSDDLRVLGVLSGRSVDFTRARYTSVAHHLNFILSKTGTRWSGFARRVGRIFGTLASTTQVGGLLPCEYSCERTSGCAGYTFNALTRACQHFSHVTHADDSPLFVSARK